MNFSKIKKPKLTRALFKNGFALLCFIFISINFLQAQFRINEFAYDCDVNDDNEIVEVRIENSFTGNLSDLSVNLYNGNGGTSYNSETLDMFTVGTNDGTYTYYTWVPSSLQNGAPDGLSLANQGTLIEFLSYEGTFAGVGGPADGVTSTDVGVEQTNSTTCDMTIQRSADGTTWSQMAATTGNNNNATTPTCTATLTAGSATCDATTSGTDTYTATFTITIGSETSLTVTASSGTPDATTITADGTITVTSINEGTDVTLTLTNTDCSLMQTVTSPTCNPTPTVDARINEFAYDCDTNDDNEIVEIRLENAFAGNLSDLTVNLYNGNGGTSYNSETLDMFTVGTNDGTYTYYTWVPSSLQNGAPDGLSLDFQGALIEFISYEGTFAATDGPANGVTSADVGVEQTNSTTCDMTIQRSADGTTWSQMAATTGASNNATTPTCTAALNAGSATCDANTSGTDTYTATFTVTIGSETSLTVAASSGTPDATTITGDGTITVTGINEGTDVNLTLTNANCSLMQTVTSPSCDTTPTCTATLTTGTATCDANTFGTDTYTATFSVTIGTETSLTVAASSGTPDATTITADGTITVTGINEGTNVTLTLANANCSLMQTIAAPTCVPAPTGITAIGTCSGITAANENTYNITITGLTSTTTYNFDLDGDGTADVTGITGVTSYTTTSGITFVDGTASQIVQIDADADGSYETMVNVHEVLCTDADDDGDLDFDSGCDVSTGMADQGYIVATTAPYNGNNVYVYVLTNASNNALTANNAGLFTSLASGGNGATTDYNVVAFNFASAADASTFIAGLTFGATGTTVTTSTVPTGCSMACGTMAYDIECCVTPIATVNDPVICEGTTATTLTLTVTQGSPVNYSIDFTDPAITDVTSTAIPTGNMITVTLPNSLAAGNYMGTITFEEFPGCSGTDDFTITIDSAPTANAGSDESICADATTFDLSTATTTATAANGTITWTTSGTGTFDNNTLATPIYTPSATDITAGSVTLTMTVTSTGAGGCPPAMSSMILTISPIVVVEAGTGATVCSTGTVDLTTIGASISGGATTGIWSSTTGGTFNGGTVFGTATIYTPSAAEIATGSVTLTLTSDASTGACPIASDMVTIPISNVSCGTFPWNGN